MITRPDFTVKPRRSVAHGSTVTDPDGRSWRVVGSYSHGVSRVRVGSLAEEVIFRAAEREAVSPHGEKVA